ncbi:MAG: DNA recombination protein RmuC [Bacteroidales bacterium]|nr:DNA recombination protein RmuC [Bacteroidales bacterium]
MDFTIILAIALIISLAVIAGLALTRSRSKADDADSVTANLQRALDSYKELAEAHRRQYEEAAERLLARTRADYESRILNLEQRLERQGKELQRTSALEFENLANRALDRQAERLADENREGINEILAPLRQNIGDFRKAVNDSYIKENSSREALSRQIDSLVSANDRIGKETRRLSDALRGNTRFQGRWGETILSGMLDAAGFVKDIHYVLQPSVVDGRRLSDDEGNLQRPDLLFLLPDDARVVIDAKTSLTAYLRYCDAVTPEEESAALKEHIASVKSHIDKLGRSQYHKYIRGAMEHTLMFMPNDAAYIAALRADATLTDYAMKRNVVIISPAHLLSILNLISQLYRIDRQNRNAEEIARLGGLLYDRIATFLTEFDTITDRLESAAKAVAKSRRTLSEGNQSVLSRANRLKDLGAKTTK